MEFEELKTSLLGLVVTHTDPNHHSYGYVLMNNPLFSLCVSCLALCIFIVVYRSLGNEKTLSYNRFLANVKADENTWFGIFSAASVISFFVGVITLILLAFMNHGGTTTSINKIAANNLYQNYMETQKDILYPVLSIDPVNTRYYRNQSTYIADNIKCDGCYRKTVGVIMERDGEDAGTKTTLEVLISYSLEENEKDYVQTKVGLREDILSYGQNTYYNPILFVKKSERGKI
jgi:hypothetical protein